MKLREYQQKAIDLTKDSFRRGNKKVCLTLCTGAGKSIIAKKIVEGAIAKGSSVIYLTYRTVLINQMRKTFAGMDVEFGTLQKHGKVPTKHYDLVLIDEVHWSHGSKLQNNINCDYLIGLSATPITAEGYALKFDEIIDVVQLKDLIDLGYASPVRVMSTSKVDTKKLKGNKDFTIKSSYEMMAKSEIIKDIVKVYKDNAEGLKTIVYSVNIEHAEKLKQEFIDNGINCDTVHSKKKTEDIIDDFRQNKIKLLINVDILTTGLDLPDIYCLILASPTKSLIKATQIYGRATRLNPEDPNKEALIIDCCEVIHNTQHPYDKFDFTKQKQDRKKKKCRCGGELQILDRKIRKQDQMMYIQISKYKCDLCNAVETNEETKVINYTFCDVCEEQLTDNTLTYKEVDNAIQFVFNCSCGHEKIHREILLTDKQLKEIKYRAVMAEDHSWDKVEVTLKEIAKDLGYHWKWVTHKMVALKENEKTPREIMESIEEIKLKGYKKSAIAYI